MNNLTIEKKDFVRREEVTSLTLTIISGALIVLGLFLPLREDDSWGFLISYSSGIKQAPHAIILLAVGVCLIVFAIYGISVRKKTGIAIFSGAIIGVIYLALAYKKLWWQDYNSLAIGFYISAAGSLVSVIAGSMLVFKKKKN